MILEFGKNYQVAVGLLWGLETRAGIERIQNSMNLHYGFTSDVKDSAGKSLKSFALADKDHNKAISLAGVLSLMSRNIIYVHKINDALYWLCIIHNHTVWSNYNVGRATAGDFIGDISQIGPIIQAALADFSANEVDTKVIMYCSDETVHDFPGGQVRSIEYFVHETRKYQRKFRIEYLQSASRQQSRKTILTVGVLLAIGVVGFAAFEKMQHNRELQKIKEQQLENARQLAQRLSYFRNLTNQIQTNQGSAVIYRALYNLEKLPLQSSGWRVTKVTYDQATPNTLNLSLARTSVGTVNSFHQAFQRFNAAMEKLDSTYDSGNKMVSIDFSSPIKFNVEPLNQQALKATDHKRLNDFITFFQLRGIKVNLTAQQTSMYGVSSTDFLLTGNNLWELRQYQFLFQRFNSLTIKSIDFNINNDDVTWTVKGTIYD